MSSLCGSALCVCSVRCAGCVPVPSHTHLPPAADAVSTVAVFTVWLVLPVMTNFIPIPILYIANAIQYKYCTTPY